MLHLKCDVSFTRYLLNAHRVQNYSTCGEGQGLCISKTCIAQTNISEILDDINKVLSVNNLQVYRCSSVTVN